MPVKDAPAVGTQVGRWTVTGPPEWITDKYQRRMMLPCRCQCGTEKLVRAAVLHANRSGEPSCGCWKAERTRTIVAETRWKDSHGRSKDPLYKLWLRIRKRCYNPAAHNYRWYGGRGIGMWEGWRNDAGAFIAYIERELGPRPSPKHSIDRIDNDGDYEPGKLRWATPTEQVHNSRPWLERHGC